MAHKFQSQNNALHNLMKQASTRDEHLDGCKSHLQHVVENTEFVNSRLNNIQNILHQDGLGGGSKAGVILDSIASSNNTISERVEFVNSRLNNIQTAQTDGNQVTAITGNSNVDGSGTAYHIASNTSGALHITSPDGVVMNAKTEAGAEQSLRCIDGALKVHKDLKEVREDMGASWTNGETTTAVDANEYSEMYFAYPTAQTSTTLNFYIQGSNTEGGTYNVFANGKNQQIQNGNGGSSYIVKSVKEGSNEVGWVQLPYRWIKVKNDTGTAFACGATQFAIQRFR